MSGGQKPAIKVVLVNKADKSQKRGGSSRRGCATTATGSAAKADKDVVAIKFADGSTVWKAADVYVNVYDSRELAPPQPHRPRSWAHLRRQVEVATTRRPDFGDDDVPFVTSSWCLVAQTRRGCDMSSKVG